MAQPVKKHSGFKRSNFPQRATATVARRAEVDVLEMEREGMTNVMQAAKSANRAAAECMEVCSSNFNSCMKSGNKAASTLQAAGNEMMECCNRILANCAEISMESLSCRTLENVMDLQDKAIRQGADDYFALVNKMTDIVFDLWDQAMEPITEYSTYRS